MVCERGQSGRCRAVVTVLGEKREAREAREKKEKKIAHTVRPPVRPPVGRLASCVKLVL